MNGFQPAVLGPSLLDLGLEVADLDLSSRDQALEVDEPEHARNTSTATASVSSVRRACIRLSSATD
jgi:hypothetical protein